MSWHLCCAGRSRMRSSPRVCCSRCSKRQSDSGMPGQTVRRIDYCSEFICESFGSFSLGPGSPSKPLEKSDGSQAYDGGGETSGDPERQEESGHEQLRDQNTPMLERGMKRGGAGFTRIGHEDQPFALLGGVIRVGFHLTTQRIGISAARDEERCAQRTPNMLRAMRHMPPGELQPWAAAQRRGSRDPRANVQIQPKDVAGESTKKLAEAESASGNVTPRITRTAGRPLRSTSPVGVPAAVHS